MHTKHQGNPRAVSIRIEPSKQGSTRERTAGRLAHLLRQVGTAELESWVHQPLSVENRVWMPPPGCETIADDLAVTAPSGTSEQIEAALTEIATDRKADRNRQLDSGEIGRVDPGTGKMRRKVRKLSKNQVLMWEGVLTFGSEVQHLFIRLSDEEREKRCLQAIREGLEEAGIDPADLIFVVLHMDEISPHVHFGFHAVAQDGISYDLIETVKVVEEDKVTGEKTTKRKRNTETGPMSRLQDGCWHAFKDLGMERGHRKSERRKRGASEASLRHRSPKQMRDDLVLEVSSLVLGVEATEEDLSRKRAAILEQEKKAKLAKNAEAEAREAFDRIIAEIVRLKQQTEDGEQRLWRGKRDLVASKVEMEAVLKKTDILRQSLENLDVDRAAAEREFTSVRDYRAPPATPTDASLLEIAEKTAAFAGCGKW